MNPLGNTFRCHEYVQAAVLVANGVELIGAEPGRRVALVFDNSGNRAAELAVAHQCQGVEVNSAAFDRAISEVKDRIFEVRRRSKHDRAPERVAV